MVNERRTHLILGPPGTGKTTTLLDHFERELEAGVRPREIAFVSFTRRAAREAQDRAKKRFNIPRTALTYVRTLHSLAFRELGLSRDDVMSDYSTFSRLSGFKVKQGFSSEDMYSGDPELKLLHIYSMSKILKCPMEEFAFQHDISLSSLIMEDFAKKYNRFKTHNHVRDYGDILADFITRGEPVPVRVAIIDEAQDLTAQQWELVQVAFAKAERIYIAGDDDQAIYRWAGADVERFINMKVDHVEQLRKSYRVPRLPHAIAMMVAGRIQSRRDKEWVPRAATGAVHYHDTTFEVPLVKGTAYDKPWLVLARNRMHLKRFANTLVEEGCSFKWIEDNFIKTEHRRAIAAYESLAAGDIVKGREVLNMLRLTEKDARGIMPQRDYTSKELGWKRLPPWELAFSEIPYPLLQYYRRLGPALHAPVNCVLSTIHQAKGGEADRVLLLSDVTRKVARAMDHPEGFDDENRVFYVGTTRAREELHILMPQTQFSYNLMI